MSVVHPLTLDPYRALEGLPPIHCDGQARLAFCGGRGKSAACDVVMRSGLAAFARDVTTATLGDFAIIVDDGSLMSDSVGPDANESWLHFLGFTVVCVVSDPSAPRMRGDHTVFNDTRSLASFRDRIARIAAPAITQAARVLADIQHRRAMSDS